MKERNIIKPEIEHVLTRGIHNKAKDKFEDKFQTWDYCVEGTTIDGRLLRIIVTFVEPNLLVVTTINLNSRK